MSATTRLLKANLHSHGRRYFSTGLAVAISTAFIVITLLFSNTMTSSLTGSVRNSYRGTTSVVTYSPADDEALNMTAAQVGNDFDALTQKIAKIQGVTAVGITAQYPIAVKAGGDQTRQSSGHGLGNRHPPTHGKGIFPHNWRQSDKPVP